MGRSWVSLPTGSGLAPVPARRSGPLRLVATAVGRPALSSHVRPALVLQERQGRALLAAAKEQDVSAGGQFSAGPAGIQLWSGPFDGPSGSRGNALLLGSVDWSYDTPIRHYITIYRAMVTAEGLEAGERTTSVLGQVLGLINEPLDGERVTLAEPPPRDPFRSHPGGPAPLAG